MVWLGSSKLPGTWKASQPPGATRSTRRGQQLEVARAPTAASRWRPARRPASPAAGPVAQVGDLEVDARHVARRRRDHLRAGVDARAPSRRGQRSASSPVRLPGPQPRSTTVARGRSAPTRREQLDERAAALVGVGQVAVGVPGVAISLHVSTSMLTDYLDVKILDDPATLAPCGTRSTSWSRRGRASAPTSTSRPVEVFSRITRLARHLDLARRDGVHRARHRVVGVRRAGRAAPRRGAVRALPGPAAPRDAGDQRHDDQPGRPAGRARPRRAAPRPRTTGAACWCG